jgi:hypothetical protein
MRRNKKEARPGRGGRRKEQASTIKPPRYRTTFATALMHVCGRKKKKKGDQNINVPAASVHGGCVYTSLSLAEGICVAGCWLHLTSEVYIKI